jgi:AraC-like DNA-binding protein
MSSYLKKEGFTGQQSCIVPDIILKEVINHPLCKGLYITDIGYYPKARFHSRERKKGSRRHILIYCVKGAGSYQINEEQFNLQANQFIILPAKSPHKYSADIENPWTIYWVHFTGENAGEFIKHITNYESHRPFTVSASEERDLLFNKIIALMEMGNNIDKLVDAYLHFHSYLTSFKQMTLNLPDNFAAYNPVEQSIAFMKTNLSGMVNLKSLADHVSLSVSHYAAIFQQKTKNSPVNYFIFLKMQHACMLLENTQLSIKQVAADLGYSDPFHFSRIFKNVMGISPKGFRVR